MICFYQIFIHLFNISVHTASLFNSKARRFIKGRKNIFKKLNSAFNNRQRTTDDKLIWFHCSSLGEFEQVRPLIEKIKQKSGRVEEWKSEMKNEKLKILITFFSPSGYEIRKNYEGADFIFYLPVDTRKNVKRFLALVHPSLVFFVKYDFWYNYLNELYKKKIPAYLVSANFREEQFKGFYGRYLRKVLSFFTYIFVQNEKSRQLLYKQKIQNVTVSGDLRYDKVSQTVSSAKKNQIAEVFKGESKVMICGSTWEKDEQLISKNQYPRTIKLIIAPHEINEEHIKSILKLFSHLATVRYSEISKEPVSTAIEKLREAKVLVIDNIGMLSHLYQYATVAYIGGGFGRGIHNILEAVAFGVPVIFGPNHQKFPEAQELIDCGGGFCIANQNDFQKVMQLLLSDEKILLMASMMCKNFVQNRRGATEKIISEISRC
jgi:3-deoxy-D-manno-octulosonic-acid transferase